MTLSRDQVMVGGGSPLTAQEKLADWPGITTTSTGCWVIVGGLGGAGGGKRTMNMYQYINSYIVVHRYMKNKVQTTVCNCNSRSGQVIGRLN